MTINKLKYVIQLKFRDIWMINRKWKKKHLYIFNIFIFSYLLHKIGEEGVCSVKVEPSFLVILTRKTNLARVLFFLEPAIPILASTSAFLNFNIPTQSTLIQKKYINWYINSNIFLNIFFLRIICLFIYFWICNIWFQILKNREM